MWIFSKKNTHKDMDRKCDHYEKKRIDSYSDGITVSDTYLTAFYLKGKLLGVSKTIEHAYKTKSVFLVYYPYKTEVVESNLTYTDYLQATEI